jgi:hypothetical protein
LQVLSFNRLHTSAIDEKLQRLRFINAHDIGASDALPRLPNVQDHVSGRRPYDVMTRPALTIYFCRNSKRGMWR